MTHHKAIFAFLLILIAIRSSHSSIPKSKNLETIIKKTEYGFSFEGAPLIAYKVFNNRPFNKRKAILLTEGVHGNEYVGLLEKFISDKNFQNIIKAQFKPFMATGGVILVIPKVNPDAINLISRNNVMGSDLNRDFHATKLHSQESFLLTKWLDQELKINQMNLVLAIDYHCCGGMLLHPEISDNESGDFYQKQYKIISGLLKSSTNSNLLVGPTKKILGSRKSGTLKNYLYEKYGTVSFTYEAPNLKQIPIKSHVQWWKEISLYLSNQKINIEKSTLPHEKTQIFAPDSLITSQAE